jgi:hypothetical protein
MISYEPLYSTRVAILFSSLLFSSFSIGSVVGQESNLSKSTEEEENYINRMIATPESYRSRRSIISHEHDFILSSVGNTATNCFVRCLTCDTYFCQVCGKVLRDKADLKLHQKCN